MMKIVDRALSYVRGKNRGGEAIRYVIAGALTTLVNFCLFALMTKIMDIGVTVSNVTSISVSILFAYGINKLFVFMRRDKAGMGLALEFIKFVGSRLFTMALEVGAVLLSVSVLGQDELIGKIEAQILVIVANYIISKMIVFKV